MWNFQKKMCDLHREAWFNEKNVHKYAKHSFAIMKLSLPPYLLTAAPETFLLLESQCFHSNDYLFNSALGLRTPSLSQTIWPRWVSRQFLTLPRVQTLLSVTFAYSLSSRKILEAVVMRQLRRWKKLWRRSLTCSHKRTSMRPCRSCWKGTTSAL